MYAILVACLLAGSTMVYAQEPAGMKPGCGRANGEHGMCCSDHGKGMMGSREHGMRWGGHGKGGLMMMLCRPGMGKVLEEAGIAKSTISKLEDMGKTARTTFEGQMIKVKREQLNIREQLIKDSPDMQAIQTCVNTKAQIIADLEFSKIKMEQDIKSLVSKDDMAKIMATLKEKRSEKMQGKKCSKTPAPERKK